MYDVNYRYPENTKSGEYGMVILGYKGSTEYCFKGTDVITRELEKCKIDGEVSFSDMHWGQKRTVTLFRRQDGWGFEAKCEDGKEIIEFDAINSFSNQIFLKALAKANRVRYYEYDVRFILVNYGKTGCEVKNDKICVYLETKFYEQIKAYYEAFQKLKALELHDTHSKYDFRCQFEENFKGFVSIRFNKRIKWKLQPWTKAVNKVLSPNITFSE